MNVYTSHLNVMNDEFYNMVFVFSVVLIYLEEILRQLIIISQVPRDFLAHAE